MEFFELAWLWTFILAPIITLLTVLAIADTISDTRSSQGAIAWVIGLLTYPFITLPLYWIFGRNKFQGYVDARRNATQDLFPLAEKVVSSYHDDIAHPLTRFSKERTAVEKLALLPYTNNNKIDLIIDGPDAFAAMFKAIREAQKYILTQFYIIRDDELGREFANLLKQKALEGVEVYLLFDEIGCHNLPDGYIRDLRDHGVMLHAFTTTKGRGNRFQINFRNHRKTVITDGDIAFIGGLNVGDEYMGREEKFGRWRDTQIRLEGPSVNCIQLAFLEDWYWVTKEVPELIWETPHPPAGTLRSIVIPSGPADPMDTCALLYTHAIHFAKDRIWISSPYFVPDEGVLRALQLAALRGVDVRILIPQKIDHRMVYMASFWFVAQLQTPGISVYRYHDGFLHQKAALIDDRISAIGTSNLDNRSFRLNFEMNVLIDDPEFAKQTEAMFEEDFKGAVQVPTTEYYEKSRVFRFGSQLARLLAPIL